MGRDDLEYEMFDAHLAYGSPDNGALVDSIHIDSMGASSSDQDSIEASRIDRNSFFSEHWCLQADS